MGRNFRRKLREQFRHGDLGSLSKYIKMDFGSISYLARDYLVLGALEYAIDKGVSGKGLSETIVDIITVLTEEYPIFIPTEKGTRRLKLGGAAYREDLEANWSAILRKKDVKVTSSRNYGEHIQSLIAFYREQLSKDKPIGSVLA